MLPKASNFMLHLSCVYAKCICNSYYFDVKDYRDIKSLKNDGNAVSLILVKEKDLSTNMHV